jgi:hypothetical protein
VSQDDPQLRARIAGLSDPDLVRMLTVDADDHSVRALLAAREEARRRNLQLEEPPAPRRAPPGDQTSFLSTGAWEPERLYPLYSQYVILAAALLVEAGALLLDLRGSPFLALARSVVVLASFVEIVHALYRLHSVLRTATERRFPISPVLVVVLNLIPCVNVIGCFVWTENVARFGAVNGRGRGSDHYLPALLYVGGLALSRFNAFASVLLLLGSQWQLQMRLLRAIGARPAREVGQGDWSSGAPV